MRSRTPDVGPTTAADATLPGSPNLKRRGFLLSLGATGAGAAVAAVSALPATAGAANAAPPAKQDSHYRETQHVRDYYRTTRI